MTLLLSWVGKDSRKISSFYIASDSRFSWGSPIQYDYGSKVFAFKNSPDIIGYCGDVLYPTTIINQLINMDLSNILFPPNCSATKRSEIIFKELTEKFNSYPSHQVMRDKLEIVHASRDNETDFICNVYRWSKKKKWERLPQYVPDMSDKVLILGSGSEEYHSKYLKYYNSLGGKTSRALFQCLCDCLKGIQDINCGGSPQLVGLFNKFNGMNFGVIYNHKRFFLGKEILKSNLLTNIEWRNELFERCDGDSMNILIKAQRQPNEFT